MEIWFSTTSWLTAFVCLLMVYTISGKWAWFAFAKRRRPPQLPWVPLLGSLPFVILSGKPIERYFMEKSKQLGNVFGFYMGSRYAVVLNGRKAIDEAFVGKSFEFADRPVFAGEAFVNPERKGIGTAPYDSNYRRYYKLTMSILKQFGYGNGVMQTRILEEVESMVSDLKQLKAKPFDPKEYVYLNVANIITAIMFGRRSDHSDTKMKQYLVNLERLFEVAKYDFGMFLFLRYVPYVRKMITDGLSIHRDIIGFCRERLDEKLAARKSDGPAADESFVNSFVEREGPDFDHKQLLMELRDFLMAGVEATSTTQRWCMIYMANNQRVQNRLHSELDESVPWKTCRSLPTLDDQPNLPYVDATVLEMMRIRTVVPLGIPRSTLCDTDVCGYFIPAGTMVIPNLYSVHMDPDEWEDPDEFKPERFLDKDGKKVINRERIIPFSVGKRSCLGEQLARQELFLFMAGLLQQFDILPPDDTQSHIEFTEIHGVTVIPSAFSVRLVPRFLD